MAFRKRYNELRKDTKRKIESCDKSWTPIDHCLAIPSLQDRYTKEELCRHLDCSQKELKRFIQLDKLPSPEQCKKIRRLLNESN